MLGLREKLAARPVQAGVAIQPDIPRPRSGAIRACAAGGYSLRSENCIDMVLLLNGVPVATAS